MKRTSLAWLASVSIVVVACTSSSSSDNPNANAGETCQQVACPSGIASYRVCASNGGANVRYIDSDGTSCTCNGSACTACAQQTSQWCLGQAGQNAGATSGATSTNGGNGGNGGTSDGGTAGNGNGGGTAGNGGGNTGDGGNGSDAGTACSITLSGAQTGTYPCNALVVYSSDDDTSALAIQPTTQTPTIVVSISRPGQPTTGTWASTDSGTKAGLEVAVGTNAWVCSVGGSSPDQGTFSAGVTALTVQTVVDAGLTYRPSGSLDATMPAVSGSTASGTVSMSVTF